MIDSSLFNIHGKLIRIDYPAIMGIINLSQNSFYSESILSSPTEIVNKAQKHLEEGAQIIDLGAASTRPGSKIVDPLLEQRLLIEAFDLITPMKGKALISIDTMHSSTAQIMLERGAHLINDVSCGEFDPNMIDVVADFNVPYIGMHMRGIPENMQSEEHLVYEDLVSEIIQYFSRKKFELLDKNVHQLIFDPGFGFSKNLNQNYELLSKLNLFQILECPILVGLSRKSMIAKILGTNAEGSLHGTIAAQTIALMQSACILRVHDVAPAKDLIRVFQEFKREDAKF
ncbi:MAG: dihydropteroate synthase [Saprospiraceae bacterium]